MHVRPVALALVLLALLITPAQAGSPHFVSADVVVAGEIVTATAKEAGLGDEAQIVVVLSGDAACINGGGNHPRAANKESVSTSSVVPVQNGHADYTLTLVAAFSPDCSPPMSVTWTNVVLTDVTNGLTVSP